MSSGGGPVSAASGGEASANAAGRRQDGETAIDDLTEATA
jgi:hypothetical protein